MDGVAFASIPCGWGAGDAATHVAPTGWGTPAPWHSVLLKQPAGVPAGAGEGGWFGGLFGDPGKWQNAHTAAFPVSTVVVWLYVEPAEARHGAGACGAFTPWHG